MTEDKLRVSASGTRNAERRQSAKMGSVYKSQHMNIFSIFLLTPKDRQKKNNCQSALQNDKRKAHAQHCA